MRLIHILCSFLLGVTISSYGGASEDNMKLEVIDPYVELHTGPGKGYPVFFVIEQGESVEVLTRRPGWYEVRAENGKIGWTSSSQISRTLQATGEPADLPEVGYGDYLKSKMRVGFTAGEFIDGELDGAETFSLGFGYRPLSWLVGEVEYGEFYGSEIRGDFYGANLLVEPYSKWMISPVVLIGGGVMSFSSQPEVVPVAIDDSDYTNYGLGLNYYLGRNFVVRMEYRSYSVSIDKAEENPDSTDNNERLATWKIGFNTFF